MRSLGFSYSCSKFSRILTHAEPGEQPTTLPKTDMFLPISIGAFGLTVGK